MKSTKSIFIASTGQNVGKTTCCLGIYSGLSKYFSSVGFIKPVGQRHVKTTDGQYVDKDVALFKEQFSIQDPDTTMSPVLFPRGFTRDYLDGKVSQKKLIQSITDSYDILKAKHDAVLIEGTGHVGVGSIVGLNNAKVASILGVEMILIVSGGLGSAFDSLAINKQMCDHYGVKVAGVILNKVLPDKQEMVLEYMHKALKGWETPILGCVPYDFLLSNPCMQDFEMLFKTELISAPEKRYQHFANIRLIATTVEVYKTLLKPQELIITPASRIDIIEETIAQQIEYSKRGENLQSGMILTGSIAPQKKLLNLFKEHHIPVIYAPINSFDVMRMISSEIFKIRKEDKEKVIEAVGVVERHVDFSAITALMSR